MSRGYEGYYYVKERNLIIPYLENGECPNEDSCHWLKRSGRFGAHSQP